MARRRLSQRYFAVHCHSSQEEPDTVTWFAFQSGASSFAIVDAFPDEDGRRAHLEGAVAGALEEQGPELLARPPLFENVDVLVTKLP